MKVVVTGSNGLIGKALLPALHVAGHQTTRLVRSNPGPKDALWDPDRGQLEKEVLVGADAVIHLAGVGIADKRWSSEQRRAILESRTMSTELIATRMAELEDGPKVLLSASAIGYYGDRGDEILTEESPPGSGFLADVCQAWEAATSAAGSAPASSAPASSAPASSAPASSAPASSAPAPAGSAAGAGIRVAHLRTGLVQSPDGGALARQLPIYKMGLGGRLSSGTQWWSWIALDDEVGAIIHVLENEAVAGPVNLASPNPVTSAQFNNTLGHVLNRPAVLVVPKLALEVLFGQEMATQMLLAGQRVAPTVLDNSGYEWRFADLEPALRSMLRR